MFSLRPPSFPVGRVKPFPGAILAAGALRLRGHRAPSLSRAPGHGSGGPGGARRQRHGGPRGLDLGKFLGQKKTNKKNRGKFTKFLCERELHGWEEQRLGSAWPGLLLSRSCQS